MNVKTRLANRKNYGQIRPLSAVKYIVIHYTANDGDTDEKNGNYFANNVPGTSAHYFVDDDSVTQSVPDNFTAHHCGGPRQGKNGGRLYGKCTNGNSIGIEICDDVKNGTIYPSQKTIENTLELVRELMETYNIPKENVIRHYDVTGKICPAYWVDDTRWDAEFWNKIEDAELNAAKATVKAKAGLADSTIRYLEDYKYGRDLILKLAKVMK